MPTGTEGLCVRGGGPCRDTGDGVCGAAAAMARRRTAVCVRGAVKVAGWSCVAVWRLGDIVVALLGHRGSATSCRLADLDSTDEGSGRRTDISSLAIILGSSGMRVRGGIFTRFDALCCPCALAFVLSAPVSVGGVHEQPVSLGSRWGWPPLKPSRPPTPNASYRHARML